MSLSITVNCIMLSIIMLIVVMLNVIMINVVMVRVLMLSVVAPMMNLVFFEVSSELSLVQLFN